MRISVLDFETSYQVKDKKKDPSPYNPDNFIVSYGLQRNCHEKYQIYGCLKHNQKETDVWAFGELQETINNCTDLLIAFNAKFELSWLKAIGIEYKGKIADPMIMAYVLARGQKWPMSLDALCKRFNVEQKKSELVDKYMKDNISFEDIPWDTIEEYGKGDIVSTWQLYQVLKEELDKEENKHLWTTVDLMHEFCITLTDMEFNGIKIDKEALKEIEDRYRLEYNELEVKLRRIAQSVWGDAPINLNSPEQLSQLFYSRKVTDKNEWKRVFNLGTELRGSVVKPKHPPKMKMQEFVNYVRQYTEVVYRTRAEQCRDCSGSGIHLLEQHSDKVRNKKRTQKCRNCSALKVVYIRSDTIAGFKFTPRGAFEAAAGGFSTSRGSIDYHKHRATGDARLFLDAYIRYNAIDTYLNTFCGGIGRALQDGYIHTSFMQCVTATGRLSSRNPNFQNMPRGDTFEVKKAITSRFEKGIITEADARQLEFRIAGELSGDPQIRADVENGIDVHSATAKWTGFSRQDSKPHTFAPVYGAMSAGKPENIAAYYDYFRTHYKGLSTAHDAWAESVLASGGYFRLPSGREYYYPNTRRYFNGSISNSTIIKNYPVQGHATGDIIPLWCIYVSKALEGYKSLFILTVHDSVVIDTHPDEIEIVPKLLQDTWYEATQIQPKIRWNYEIKMPLEIEIKQGKNWLEMKNL